MEKKFKLTQTDMNAIKRNDSNYINGKGAKCYVEGNYAEAIEYYRIAAAMKNDYAISNLGYCYLYGRDIESNLSLAIAYFELAASMHNIDACYKLGDIYENAKWGVQDKEMAMYYYRWAASLLINDDWEETNAIAYTESLQQYPSLCFALGRAKMPGGDMPTDLNQAYQFLMHAQAGYKIKIAEGTDFYEKPYAGVLEHLQNSVFDDIRNKYKDGFDNDGDDELLN